MAVDTRKPLEVKNPQWRAYPPLPYSLMRNAQGFPDQLWSANFGDSFAQRSFHDGKHTLAFLFTASVSFLACGKAVLHRSHMSKALGSALKAARESAGLSQAAVAERLGISKAAVGQWERGVNEPSTTNLIEVCGLLNINVSAATNGLVKLLEVAPEAGDADPDDRAFIVKDRRPEMRDITLEIYKDAQKFAKSSKPAIEVPILETAAARKITVSDESGVAFAPNLILINEIIDLCPRPPGLENVRKVQGLYVPHESNAPRFELGELLFVQVGRIARIGDYVLVRSLFKPDEDYGAQSHYAAIGRVLSSDEKRIVIWQSNPASEIKISLDHVTSIDRVYPVHELFGK